jgi:RNA polymerase sporulation-specific sigma factor
VGRERIYMNEELINDEVIKLAQNGDQEALDLILKEYKKLIYLNIRNYFLVGADQDDLLQEGTIGLLKAIKNYSEGKASFKTFATLCIRRQILTTVRSSTAQKNSALNEASGNNLETEDGHEDYPKLKQ